jgi:hypothetical protein
MVHLVGNGQYISSADMVLGHVVLALHRQAIILVCSRLLQALSLVVVPRHYETSGQGRSPLARLNERCVQYPPLFMDNGHSE